MNVSDLCLGTLCLGDASGYDIKKLFEAAFSHFHGASYGSIYPSLGKLTEQGLIEARTEAGIGKPDRKLYSITEAGEQAFYKTLTEAEPDEQIRSDFLVILFFAHMLPTDRLQQVVERMESHYETKLAYLRSIVDLESHSAGIRLGIEIGIAAVGARLDTLRAHKDQLLTHHREAPKCDLSSL